MKFSKITVLEVQIEGKAEPPFIPCPVTRYFVSRLPYIEALENIREENPDIVAVGSYCVVETSVNPPEDIIWDILGAPWKEDEGDLGWVIREVGNLNFIGFDPKRHAFICHKCGGFLHGEPGEGQKWCGCISGWIRPFQNYVSISEMEMP